MRRHRSALLIVGALLPLGVVIFVNFVVESELAYRLATNLRPNPEAKGIVADLSAELNHMAVLVIGGGVILFREQREKALSRSFWLAAVAVVTAAVASCFAGFRYRIALARQISADAFNLDTIAHRLDWQIWLLILSLSALIVLAMLCYLPRAGPEVISKPGED